MLRSDVFLPLLYANDPTVTDLSLKSKFVTAQTLTLVGNALSRNTCLTRLDLSGNELSDDDVFSLVEGLRCNKKLHSLDLSGNPGLTDKLGKALVACLFDVNGTLTHIGCEGTNFAEETRFMLEKLLLWNSFPRQLKAQAYRAMTQDPTCFAFVLEHDPSDPMVCNERCTAQIVDVLIKNVHVRTLRLDECCAGEHNIAVLAPLFAATRTILRLSLRRNRLGSESVRYLCEAMRKAGQESSLLELDLSENDIDDDGARHLITLLETNTTLRAVHLTWNTKINPALVDTVRCACALNAEPPQLKAFVPRLIANTPTVTSIVLRGTEDEERPGKNYLTSLGCMTLCEALAYNTHVQRLEMPNNHVGAEGCRAIMKLIAHNTTLTSVDLSGNPVMDEGVRYLILGMRQNDSVVCCTVEGSGASPRLVEELTAMCHLNIQPPPIKSILQSVDPLPAKLDLSRRSQALPGKWQTLYPESIPYVLTILRKNPQVTECDLSCHTTLGDEGVEMLFEILVDNPRSQLRRLLLPETGISDAVLKKFDVAMRRNYTLQALVIAPNAKTTTKVRQQLDTSVSLNFFPPMVKDLVPLLRENVEGVVEVDFSRTAEEYPAFGDDTAKLVVEGLRGNTHIQRLSLRRQKLTGRTVGYLCRCLEVNKTLTYVDFSDNDIGSDGVEELNQVLQHNTTLTTLLLSRNPLSERSSPLFIDLLRTWNRTLMYLDVTDCRMNVDSKRQIDALVSFNRQPPEFRLQYLDRLASVKSVQFIGDASMGFLTDDSCKSLQLAMRVQPHTVSSIRLTYHPDITDAGVLTLLEIAREYPSVTSLDLRHNPCISGDVIAAVLEVIDARKGAMSVDFTPNSTAPPSFVRPSTREGHRGAASSGRLSTSSADTRHVSVNPTTAAAGVKRGSLAASTVVGTQVTATNPDNGVWTPLTSDHIAEIQLAIQCAKQSEGFQRMYRGLERKLQQGSKVVSAPPGDAKRTTDKSASGQKTNVRRWDPAPGMTPQAATLLLDCVGCDVTVEALDMTFALLNRFDSAADAVAGIRLQATGLTDECLVHLLDRPALCHGHEHLEVMDLRDNGATLTEHCLPRLASFVEQCPALTIMDHSFIPSTNNAECTERLTVLSDDREVTVVTTNEHRAALETIQRVVDRNRATRAVSAVQAYFAEAEAAVRNASMRYASRPSSRARGSSAGKPLSRLSSRQSVDSAESLRVERDILLDALKGMPKRTPYSRGMYM